MLGVGIPRQRVACYTRLDNKSIRMTGTKYGTKSQIFIRPEVSGFSIRRSADGKSQQIAGKVFDALAVRRADADLHDFLDDRQD